MDAAALRVALVGHRQSEDARIEVDHLVDVVGKDADVAELGIGHAVHGRLSVLDFAVSLSRGAPESDRHGAVTSHAKRAGRACENAREMRRSRGCRISAWIFYFCRLLRLRRGERWRRGHSLRQRMIGCRDGRRLPPRAWPAAARSATTSRPRPSFGPGRYDLYSCKDIEVRVIEVRTRQVELEELIGARVARRLAAPSISAIAYRSEYIQTRGELKELAKAGEREAVRHRQSSSRAAARCSDRSPRRLRASAAPSPSARAWRRRSRAASAPCRSWCRGRSSPSGRTSCFDHRRDFVGRLDLSLATSIAPTSTLASSARSGSSAPWNGCTRASLVDPALRQRRKNLLVLPPLDAERLLPVDIGLDAVAVADVHRSGARQARRSRGAAPRRPSAATSSM